MEDRTIVPIPSAANPSIGAFLHGRLSITVVEARKVEGKGSARFFHKLERAVTSSIDGVDPYCSVNLGYDKILQTHVAQNTSSPVWNNSVVIDVCHDFYELQFRVKAAKRTGPLAILSKVKHISMLTISAARLARDHSIQGWLPLGPYIANTTHTSKDSEDSEPDNEPTSIAPDSDVYGDIHISVHFTPIYELDDYVSARMPEMYFPVREGIKVTFYQDADCTPDALPVIPFHPTFQHSRCWSEQATAIMAATELIYITGWAVWPELVMVRTDHPGDRWNGLTLGEMLVQKAEEGVTVCVMVWDEVVSTSFSSGLMGTHDEEVVAYFYKTKVNCIKVGRQNPKNGPFADLNDALMFTHHQKTVIVSTMDHDMGRNRLEAWIGGLDLTNGRYDNQDHSLFRTLQTHHADPDFWQACAVGITAASGPREPWHDIHSHVSGTAAWDILCNFEGRWARQSPGGMKNALYKHSEQKMVQAHEELQIRDGSFDVQVLRSINEASTELDRTRPGLLVRKNACADNSIHRAYIHQIRSAKHFIYFENQYFLGSSHMWESSQRGGFSGHLVAIELAEKICSKIRRGERFAAYISIPLFPEGAPDSGAVQEILSHQRKTLTMITTRIQKTIDEVGCDSCISDWLNLFCLVNRESTEGGQGNGGEAAVEQKFSQSRRFMIYLHSKFAIFDDTVAIVGSANINSRSLDGSRDTEIAIAAWQPEHMATGGNGYLATDDEASLPKGDVAAFRASVWAEHFGGTYHEEFEDPSSLECVHLIRKLTAANWAHFMSNDDEVGDMPHGHLAMYPYRYEEGSGAVKSSVDSFPDFPTALTKGRSSPAIPNMLTG